MGASGHKGGLRAPTSLPPPGRSLRALPRLAHFFIELRCLGALFPDQHAAYCLLPNRTLQQHVLLQCRFGREPVASVHAAAPMACVMVAHGAVVSSAVVDADRASVAVPASLFPATVGTTCLHLPNPHFFRRNVRHLFFGVHPRTKTPPHKKYLTRLWRVLPLPLRGCFFDRM